jgi:short-subunit dehydrogenase
MNNRTYALITGAGSGLGKAFANECARRGMNLLLLALPGENTRNLASDLEVTYGIDTRVFELDMTDADTLNRLLTHITATYRVFFLVNNAGMGGTSLMTETPVSQIDRIIQLNVRGMALVTRMLLPVLQQNEAAFILNVSSMAAFTPIAFKTVYPASKAFVSSFSLGLRQELAGQGVSVSVVYPGAIMTNVAVTRRILGQGFKGRISLMSVQAIAGQAIAQALKGKPVIIPGLMNRLSHLLLSLLPISWKMKIVSQEVRREIQFVPSF